MRRAGRGRGGAQDHQLVGECACGGADHGRLGEDVHVQGTHSSLDTTIHSGSPLRRSLSGIINATPT
eukprot:1053703-Prymnesium_polylepis.1